MPAYIRTHPLSYGTDAAVATTGSKFTIPTAKRAKIARVNTSAAAYVGVGNASSIPAASTSNAVYQASGTTDYMLDDNAPTYLYVYSTSSTIAVFVSFLG